MTVLIVSVYSFDLDLFDENFNLKLQKSSRSKYCLKILIFEKLSKNAKIFTDFY